MELNYSTEELAFRDEVRGWLDANLPEDLRRKAADGEHYTKDELLRWHRILAKQGWVAPSWPEEWGGPGWDVTRRYIFEQETGLAGTPPIVAFGVVMCAQVLLKFGTEAQKKRFLPGIYNGDVFWVQGYSEPGSGSDLASVKTRAERRGDQYVVNGQKIWTTLGQHGDWIFCLVRTDLEAKKQEGISFLLIDMKTPGITVRPLILMDGGHEVNEVFFDDVKVPVENLVHEEGKGWTVAKYLLGHERLNTGRIGGSKRELARLKAFAAKQVDGSGRSLMDDPRFRDKVTRVEVELMALEITNLRFLDAMRGGKPPGAEVSILKIRGTEIQQALTELLMQAVGPMAAPFKAVGEQQAVAFDDVVAGFTPRYANYRKTSIYAGSNEIQRNIIAKATLGL
jgi:alkylation response protein AidB-like acyl-CoA dehydrogenase